MEHREPLLDASNTDAEYDLRSRKSTYYGLKLTEHNLRYGRLAEDPVSWQDRCKRFASSCSSQTVAQWMLRRVPVINVFRYYNFRKYIIGDIIAGLSVGVVTVPQSLGYAKLANVPVILGLYTSFFPVLVYFIFGSSRHVSMGIMALCCLVIAEAVKKQGIESVAPPNGTLDITSSGFSPEDMAKISIAVSISFLAGIFQILMSVFHLGFIVSYMSEPFVSAYLAASNLRVLTHQVQDMLGVPSLKGYSGPGDYFYSIYGICYNLPSANLIQILISVISLAVLILVKKCVNERFAKKIKVPIPIDIIIVIIFTVASHFGRLEEKFGVKILKVIPQGIPAVTIPSVGLMWTLAFDSFMLAIVAYMMVGMMAKLFSQRHNYPVDNNQELLASGLSSAAGAFFCSLAGSTSPPRCFLMEATGGHTQVAYMISALLALLTMLVIAPLFQSLPVCVLSCIIFIACVPIFRYYVDWLKYWRTNKYDFSVWVVTALANLIISVDIGLLVGMAFSLVVVHFQMQQPETGKLLISEPDEIFLDRKHYSKCISKKDIVVFRFESPIYFATLDVFKESLFSKTVSLISLKKEVAVELPDRKKVTADVEVTVGTRAETLNPSTNQNETMLLEQKSPDVERDENNVNDASLKLADVNNIDVPTETEEQRPSNIVVDCSTVPFIDTSGATLLAQLQREYAQFKVNLYLTNCCEGVIQQLRRVRVCKTLVDESIYPSVQDVFVALNI